MDYIGIDIGSTASKVVVKGDHDIHFVLARKPARRSRIVYWKTV